MNSPEIVPSIQYPAAREGSGIGVIQATPDGECLAANEVACRLLGYRDEDLRGIPVTALLGMGHGESLHTGFSSRRLPFVRADGSHLHVLATSSRLPDGNLLLEFQDLSDVTRVIDSLSRREIHYRSLVEVSCDWVWEVDADGIYTYVSPRVRTLLGYEPNEVIGRTPFDLMPPDEAERCRQYFVEVMRSRSAFSAFENVNRHRDGSLVVLESSGVPIINEYGEYLGYRGIDRDVTARKQVEQTLARNREMLAEAQRLAHIGSWEWNEARQCFEFSDELCRIFGVAPEEFTGTRESVQHFVHPQDRQLSQRALERILRDHKPLCVEHRIIRADGAERIIEVRAEIRGTKAGQDLRIFGTTQDITEQRRTEHGLQQLTQALDNTREAVVILDGQRRVVAVNQAYTRMTGHVETDILGKDPFELRAALMDPMAVAEIWEAVRRDGRWEGEVEGERSNGERYIERLSISQLSDLRGQAANYIAVMADISRQKEFEEELRYVATHDLLTGLPNRQTLADEIRRLLIPDPSHAGGFALLMLDIDGFKAINHSLGHGAGDRLIKTCARRLQATVRHGDTVARLNGDEFAIIAHGITDEEDAGKVIAKINQTLQQTVTFDDEEIEPSVCIGVVFSPAHGHHPESLLQHAETALSRVRGQGRNLCCYYTPDMSAHVSEQFSLERALRRALRTGEGISAHFQPQVDAVTGLAVGAEALMRWTHPELGVISPARFIPIAEQSDLIDDLGEWMLETTCADLRRWLDAGLKPIRMAINVSSREVTSGRLINNIRMALDRYRIPPELIEVEMTERSLIADTLRAHSVLHELKDLGVFIAIDDFGTGYSSLSYLKSFPLNILKIDKSFIDGIPGNDHDEAIAHAVIAMAHGLKLQVTAEGVETEEQRDFLREHSCDFLQGYLVSEPMPAARFARWLSENG